MRRAIAAAMARSKREIPHFYLEHTVALTGLRARLDALNADRPPAERLLPAVFVIRATARALARHPGFNGHYVDGEFRPAERVHLGTAVAIRGGGLIAPAIHDADRLDLDQLMARLKDLVARARGGGLRGSELADPTATLSSLGERGVDALYGVIHPPQVALIGAGRPVRRPWAEGDAVAVREVMTLTLAADHRVGDGHAGALFLAEIGRLIETPEEP
jgi:pyruvate dehydrogenase E2 component (dihydrolipoamide acetyltransferase)